MPTLDSLPDELLQEILNYVMIRDNPFNIGDCIRTAKVAADCLQAQEAGSSTQPEPVPTVDLPPQTILPPSHFGGEEQRESLIKEDLERKRKRDKFAKNKSQWPIYDFSLAVHQPHLLDWRVASSVCNRFRSLGKEAFFSHKVFVMDRMIAGKLQNQDLPNLSSKDQKIAVRYIRSMILVVKDLCSLDAFRTLRHRIAGFSGLRYVDFFFNGGQTNPPLVWIINAAKHRMLPPPKLVNALSTVRVPLDRLTIGVLVSPDTQWDVHEKQLERYIYPFLSSQAYTTA